MGLSIARGYSPDYLYRDIAKGRESYYLDATTAGEPPGQWWGAGAEALGLTGEVDHEVMNALYSHFLDPTDPRFADEETRHEARRLGRAPGKYKSVEDVVAERLAAEPDALPERVREIETEARKQARQPVMFIDATFSPVKSFTVLHTALARAELDAERAGDESARQVWAELRADAEAALWAGNNAMLGQLAERAGYSRVGRHGAGAGRWVDAHDWTVASFHQSDSRDHDPQQHIHNAILNRVQCADGEWRTLDSRAIHEWKQAAGSFGERVMEEELSSRLGVRWELRPDGAGREIVDIDQAAMDLFSTRSKNISTRLAELAKDFEKDFKREPTALELTRLRQWATLSTREGKEHAGETRADQLDRWDRELRTEVAGGLHQVAADIAVTAARGPVAREDFSPSGVIAEAIAACQETRAAFSRSELERHIVMRLPHLGGMDVAEVRELVTGLADQAIKQLVEVTGAEPAAMVPEELRLADGRSVYATPGGPKYATETHIVAEQALRRAAVERGRAAASTADARQWLAGAGQSLGADQAAAVEGLLTSGAAVSMLVGPAGTGKSYTLAQLAEAWRDIEGGRVIGLATAQVAADVLAEDGITASNTERWLTAQKRLDTGRTRPGDALWRLDKSTIVVLDESSMADQVQVAEVRRRVDAAGARLILAGDPAQLAAVGAGGAMDVVGGAEHADVYHLSEVRRFAAEWERPASLRLRDGDTTVLAEYDRHGRIRDCGTVAQAMDAAARAYVGDVLAGRTAVVVTPTNEMAARVARRVRDQLVATGHVEAHGIELARDGNTAGVGDVIAARKNNRAYGVTNREQYTVTGLLPNGGLAVTGSNGQTHYLPGKYVEEHVTLGYAGTAHSVEGVTVDSGHGIWSSATSREAGYVEATRGRHNNTAWVVTLPEGADEHTGETHAKDRRDALSVMADVLERDNFDERAALAQAAEAARQARDMHTIAARQEDAIRQVTRRRLDAHLDELATDGVLTPEQRQALAVDQGSEQLSRLLRAVEQAGHDPAQALRHAIEERDLGNARSLAQVLHFRVTTSYADTLAPTTLPEQTPAGLSEEWREYLAQLGEAAADRRRELGTEIAQEAPRWAVDSFGPVPDDPMDRMEWEQQAGRVAAYREATGWADEAEPIGPAPGLSSTERRAEWHAAWTMLGRPETTQEEHRLSDGALRNRVRAWEREQTWAPGDVYDQQRITEQQLADARTELAFASTKGLFVEGEQTDEWRAAKERRVAECQAQVEMLEQAARDLEEVAQARAAWLVETALTRQMAERAEAELASRGRPIGAEDDRVTAEEWLEEHRRTVDAEAPHHITEADLAPDEDLFVVPPAAVDEHQAAEADVDDAEDTNLRADEHQDETAEVAAAADEAESKAVDNIEEQSAAAPDVDEHQAAAPDVDEEEAQAEEAQAEEVSTGVDDQVEKAAADEARADEAADIADQAKEPTAAESQADEAVDVDEATAKEPAAEAEADGDQSEAAEAATEEVQAEEVTAETEEHQADEVLPAAQQNDAEREADNDEPTRPAGVPTAAEVSASVAAARLAVDEMADRRSAEEAQRQAELSAEAEAAEAHRVAHQRAEAERSAERGAVAEL